MRRFFKKRKFTHGRRRFRRGGLGGVIKRHFRKRFARKVRHVVEQRGTINRIHQYTFNTGVETNGTQFYQIVPSLQGSSNFESYQNIISPAGGTRLGFKTNVTGGYIKMQYWADPLGLPYPATIRVILCLFPFPPATYNLDGILDNNVVNYLNAPRNRIQQDYRILKDKTFQLGPTWMTHKLMFWKIPKHTIHFFNNLGSSWSKNGMYLYTVTDSTVTNSIVCNISIVTHCQEVSGDKFKFYIYILNIYSIHR